MGIVFGLVKEGNSITGTGYKTDPEIKSSLFIFLTIFGSSSYVPFSMELSLYNPKLFDEYKTNMISYLVSNGSDLTNFKPGSRILTLIEALSLELAKQSAEYYQGHKNGIAQSAYDTFQFQRLDGLPSSGFLRFVKVGNPSDYTIPSFSVNVFGITYQSGVDVTFPAGQDYFDVQISSSTFGSNQNTNSETIDTDKGLGDFEPNFIADFDRIYNPNDIIGGTDIESEEDRKVRFQNYIQSLSRSTVQGVTNGLASIPGMAESYIEENKNPNTGDLEVGWIIAYISDGTGILDTVDPDGIYQRTIKTISGVLDDPDYPGYRAAGTRLAVKPISIQWIDISYSISIFSDSILSDDSVISIINSAITAYINKQKNGFDILMDLVKANILSAHNDFYSCSIPLPGADIVVDGGSLPRVRNLTCIEVLRVNPT